MAPPVGGYSAWYDASQITGQADNTALSSWADLSGNGHTLTSSFPGTYYSSTAGKTVNGLPAVWFSSSYYSLGSFSQNAPFTLAFVVKADVTSGNRILLNSNAGNTTFWWTGGNWELYAGSSLDLPAALDTAVHAVYAVNAASGKVQVDSTSVTGSPGGNPIGGAVNYIGANDTSRTSPWSGAVCEILVYPSALTAANIASLNTYFQGKWMAPPTVTGTAGLPLGPVTVTATGAASSPGVVTGTASLPLGPVTVSAAAAASIPPPPPSGPPEWSFQLLHTDGTPAGPLTSATARHLTWQLDAGATATLALPADHPEAVPVVELGTDILVARNGRLLFRGRVGGSTETAAADTNTVTFTAVDYRGMLDHRIIWPTGSTVHYAAVDQADIAWDLINDTQGQPGGNMGITRGAAAATGVTRTRDYTPGTGIGQTITELGHIDSGFDWEIDPTLAFNIFHPQRGNPTPTLLVYGRDIISVDTSVNPSGYANAVYYTGDQSTTPAALYTASPPADAGRWEVQLSDPSAAPQATVNEQAAAALAVASRRWASFNATLAAGLWDPSLLWLGDAVRLVVQTGHLNVDVTRRVVQIDVTLDDNGGETVVLAIGVGPARLSDRINATAKTVSSLTTNPGGGGGGGGTGTVSSVPYIYAGALNVATSPPITPHLAMAVTGLSATLGTAGTSTTTVNLLQNGSVVGTVNLTSGQTYAYTSFTAAYGARTDTYQVSITAVGSGAANLGGEIEL